MCTDHNSRIFSTWYEFCNHTIYGAVQYCSRAGEGCEDMKTREEIRSDYCPDCWDNIKSEGEGKESR